MAKKADSFTATIVKCSELLVKRPQAATLELRKEDGKSFYAWVDNTIAARGVRAKLRKLLKALWQSGAYNYQKIADAIRLQVLDVQGLLDDQFRESKGIK